VSEFCRLIDRRHLKGAPEELLTTPDECAALAQRFGLVKIRRLGAKLALVADGAAVNASGTMEADFVQSCAISGDDLPVRLHEAVTFRFVPALADPPSDAEIELDDAILDEIDYSGTTFDLGEAVAQSLALAIDPYAVGPSAEAARAKHGLNDEGPKGALAQALAALKK
jgi:uncharacterized metal-binding protein YceD (DUF177 family)